MAGWVVMSVNQAMCVVSHQDIPVELSMMLCLQLDTCEVAGSQLVLHETRGCVHSRRHVERA